MQPFQYTFKATAVYSASTTPTSPQPRPSLRLASERLCTQRRYLQAAAAPEQIPTMFGRHSRVPVQQRLQPLRLCPTHCPNTPPALHSPKVSMAMLQASAAP